jgi:hypothetical protein
VVLTENFQSVFHYNNTGNRPENDKPFIKVKAGSK